MVIMGHDWGTASSAERRQHGSGTVDSPQTGALISSRSDEVGGGQMSERGHWRR